MHRNEQDETSKPGSRAWDVSAAIDHLAHWLSIQGPIKDFVHHNTLHAYQNRKFSDALEIASRVYGAHPLMSLSWYQDAYHRGQIQERALTRVLRALNLDEAELEQSRKDLLASAPTAPRPEGYAQSGLRSAWKRERGIDLDALVHPTLFRFLSSYLDQGVSIWRMPHASQSFWSAIQMLASESVLPLFPLNDKECRSVLGQNSTDAIQYCLKRIVGDEENFEAYLLEMCLAHPGWSGMVRTIEIDPNLLIAPRKISLQDMLAVELLLELGCIRKQFGPAFAPVSLSFRRASASPDAVTAQPDLQLRMRWIWHQALEWSLYEDVFASLERHGHTSSETNRPDAEYQAFFCIDDRECSLRRHLEETEPSIETFASAGFYEIDIMFQSSTSMYPLQHCPVVVKPKFLVKEVDEGSRPRPKASFSQRMHLEPQTNTLFRGWLLTQTLGLWSLLRLAWNVLRPGADLLTEPSLTHIETPTRLQLLREDDAPTPEGYWLGYSYSEMADRVQNVFRSVGLTHKFSKLIVFFAHGSSSANNPHFAAYNCGACSGRPGAPNARSFAWMANRIEVRQILKDRGFDLPRDSHVVGALHDTSRDEVVYFDLESLPAERRTEFEKFDAAMKTALMKNAKERTRRFELAPRDLTPEKALAHVRQRAASIFEPRPELNHATNALCIIGRRELTRGLFFDRRAFLNSYDPTQDTKGDILASILGAAIPVCGGINLEYFFSRVDNEVYGAGTKLPHNVVSLIGVANGVEGDLRTGLPSQMIEIHDPVRLLMVVEQTPELALDAVRRNPTVFEWVENEWILYSCISPKDHKIYLYEHGAFVLVSGLPQDYRAPSAPNSLVVTSGKRENISVFQLGAKT